MESGDGVKRYQKSISHIWNIQENRMRVVESGDGAKISSQIASEIALHYSARQRPRD